ncbi:diguanylate cyclase domain-containing protein, partial [Vibrio parahaemolyticus]|uniref:diguanylate cyclase domain-containing protein n=1 Tax=Vibrio parahaemolyticus TaxID=670 RepID=UPI00155EA1FA
EKAQQAKIFAEQIRLAVETETALQSFKTEVTMSFGISQLSEGQSLQEALAEADEALYSSKPTGRNLVTLFGEGKDLNYKFVPAPAKSA